MKNLFNLSNIMRRQTPGKSVISSTPILPLQQLPDDALERISGGNANKKGPVPIGDGHFHVVEEGG